MLKVSEFKQTLSSWVSMKKFRSKKSPKALFVICGQNWPIFSFSLMLWSKGLKNTQKLISSFLMLYYRTVWLAVKVIEAVPLSLWLLSLLTAAVVSAAQSHLYTFRAAVATLMVSVIAEITFQTQKSNSVMCYNVLMCHFTWWPVLICFDLS